MEDFLSKLSDWISSFSLSRRDKILIESLLLLSWEYGNVPTWLNLMCECCHVSVSRQGILFTLPYWSYPRGRHLCREVKTDTVYFSELCKSFVAWPKVKSCGIDSSSSVPLLRNIWRLPAADTMKYHSWPMPHGASGWLFKFQLSMKVHNYKWAWVKEKKNFLSPISVINMLLLFLRVHLIMCSEKNSFKRRSG